MPGALSRIALEGESDPNSYCFRCSSAKGAVEIPLTACFSLPRPASLCDNDVSLRWTDSMGDGHFNVVQHRVIGHPVFCGIQQQNKLHPPVASQRAFFHSSVEDRALNDGTAVPHQQ